MMPSGAAEGLGPVRECGFSTEKRTKSACPPLVKAAGIVCDSMGAISERRETKVRIATVPL